MQIEVTITDADVNRALTQIGERVGNLQPALEDFGEYMLLQTRRYFDSEVSPGGQKWADISPAWKRQKQKEGRDRGIGKYTLAMRDGITYVARPRSLVVGSNRPYAARFQLGSKDGTQEARPFLGLTPEDRRELIAALSDHVGESI
ncbi:phage virion morphoproteinsis protein [Leptolyngbya sp. Heron Island J]|uniref:phage virion morphogenesis protein n=1 Tax=Leptolyngbya sp. Heron Island J TaxID=1385935 RepID=UPI0003B9AD6F|nr:phage virion morphogenesis protein [Leptolyngbya sp. Heron Island J]ESA37749.1 phage virion morphoproteinsis protein [Leptolyngbya sp. Heron Island J]